MNIARQTNRRGNIFTKRLVIKVRFIQLMAKSIYIPDIYNRTEVIYRKFIHLFIMLSGYMAAAAIQIQSIHTVNVEFPIQSLLLLFKTLWLTIQLVRKSEPKRV